MNKYSATLVRDCRRWLCEMQQVRRSWWITESGDLVTAFECRRMLGWNDDLDRNQ